MFCWVSELGFRARRAAQAGYVLPAQVPLLPSTLLLELNGTERKGGKEYGEDPCTASENMCVFCSQPRHCFCLVNQKNICILLFQSAHQQTTAQPLLCPCSHGFPLTEVVEMNPAAVVLSSALGKADTALHLNSSLPGPYSHLHQNDSLGTELELQLK